METLWQDVRYAVRGFARARGFTLGAVLTIALGIGGSTAIFGVVDTVLLRPLPFADGDRLVRVQQQVARPDGTLGRVGVSQLNFVALGERLRTVEHLVAHRFRALTLGGGDLPERVVGIQVTEGWLPTVGVRPALGRGFSADEARAGAGAGVVVLGHGLWQRRFGGAADVLGRTVVLDGRPHTVVGVMPAGYAYPYGAELWLPLPLDRAVAAPRDMNVTARLRPGATQAQLDAELRALAGALAREVAANREMAGLVARPMRTELVGDFRGVLLALLAAVGFVLLIACANVANLLLARATARRREFAIRSALGAARGRQLRQLLTESVLLAGAGGALGVLLTAAGAEALGALIPESMRDLPAGVRVDARLLLFSLAVSLATGVAFGLAPARRATATRLTDVLRGGGRASSGGLRLLHGLVVAEVAIATLLLTGGGLLLRDLQRRLDADLGFVADGVLTLNVALPESRYADAGARSRLVTRLEQRLAAVAGVQAAGITTILPFGSGNTLVTIEVEGRAAVVPPSVNYRMVTPGLFAALGLPVVRGRPLAATDVAGSEPVVVVSAAMAERYWPGENPVGRRVRRTGEGEPWLTVVGVAGDVSEAAEADTQEAWYVPYAQGAPRTAVSFATLNAVVVVRAAGDPAALTTALRRAVAEVDDAVPVHTVATLDRLRADAFAAQRLSATLTGAFATLGLLLAALGLHAVMSYATVQRTREIGIRLALGADAAVVLREVLARSAGLVAAGLTLGLGAALVLTQYLRGMLAEVGPRDPLVLGVVTAVLVAVGLVAAYVPARRAARVEPVVALRGE